MHHQSGSTISSFFYVFLFYFLCHHLYRVERLLPNHGVFGWEVHLMQFLGRHPVYRFKPDPCNSGSLTVMQTDSFVLTLNLHYISHRIHTQEPSYLESVSLTLYYHVYIQSLALGITSRSLSYVLLPDLLFSNN